ncbi:MAG TPA: YbhB/YbcL family Raf kinase inhibitor-like protein [Methylocella sp.]|nr:YbhB/YbcL family Raf kinase inhibitor-like protein [Methylocella sp.]
MRLRSIGFCNSGPLPRRFTCDGDNLSPPLHWIDAPAETASFAIFCDDPDAQAGTWHQWAIYNIPADWASLTEDIGRPGSEKNLKQAINDFGRPGYDGPCPPHRHGPHRYHFRLLALSIDRLQLRKDASCREAEREARKHLISEAILVGLYER